MADSAAMIARRRLIAAIPATLLAGKALSAQAEDFTAFVASLRAQARRKGISAGTIQRAFAGIAVNEAILGKLHHPPESTLTWAQYRQLLLTDQRIAEGRAAYRHNYALFRDVQARFGVSAGIIAGIWGLESSYGAKTGDYRVVEALANCAWSSTRRPFFTSELIAALQIIDAGDVAPAHMTGSYAGAMGQPQFMPSSYLHYAIDLEGTGRPNIWTSVPDVLGSIANYLARSGWRPGESWGIEVRLPPSLDGHALGREDRQPLAEWARLGVRAFDGGALRGAAEAALIQPDGAGGDAFLVFANFNAIRRYNPSDYYALLTGLLGDQVLA